MIDEIIIINIHKKLLVSCLSCPGAAVVTTVTVTIVIIISLLRQCQKLVFLNVFQLNKLILVQFVRCTIQYCYVDTTAS